MDRQQIVYGVGCVWWDAWEQAGVNRVGLPCCPFCTSVLMQVDEQKWWEGAKEYEAKQPGYVVLLSWLKGKCFKSMSEAKKAYEAAEREHA